MKILLIILLFNSLATFGQVTKKVSEQATFIKGGRFKGEIYSAGLNTFVFKSPPLYKS